MKTIIIITILGFALYLGINLVGDSLELGTSLKNKSDQALTIK